MPDGPTSPPRANGELVFESPWESRAFALTHALCDAGSITWQDFREHLIREIADWERAHADQAFAYYERWLAATESLLAERGLCSIEALQAKTSELSALPEGHDHDHPHTDARS